MTPGSTRVRPTCRVVSASVSPSPAPSSSTRACLILDEATSALDPDSEAIVNANIKRIAEGRTVIVISHRLSSLVNSDAIMVLERGSLLDIGKHAELLERCEIYRSLWGQQNGHIEAAIRKTQLARGPFYAS